MAIVFNNLSAGGSGKTLYEHNIKHVSNGTYQYSFSCTLITNDATPLTLNTFIKVLYDLGYNSKENALSCSGFNSTGSDFRYYLGIYSNGTNLFSYHCKLDCKPITIEEAEYKVITSSTSDTSTFYNTSYCNVSSIIDYVREL